MKGRPQGLVLGLHPFSRGFSWAVFEGPIAPHDWGIVQIKEDRQVRCLARMAKILERHEPVVVILEQFDQRPARRGKRVKLFCNAILHLCATKGIDYRVYSRAVVRTCFVSVGARTRYEIAKVIALHIDALRSHLPPKRRPWQSEDCRQSLFDAAALAMTHYAVSGNSPPIR